MRLAYRERIMYTLGVCTEETGQPRLTDRHDRQERMQMKHCEIHEQKEITEQAEGGTVRGLRYLIDFSG